MKKVRVLQVLASLDRGGAESMIMNLFRNIDYEKIQFDFVANYKPEKYAFEKEINKLGGKVFLVPRFKIINYWSYRQAWIKLLKEHPEWEIIHGHHTSPAFIYLKIAKQLKRKTIAHSHIAGGEITFKFLAKIIIRFPLRYIADYLFACSNLAANWMFGNKSEKSQILKNAINTDKFVFAGNIKKQKRNEKKLEKKFVIGHVGRFDTQKNHSFLIDIFNLVNIQNNNTVLLLIGDGQLRHEIETKVNKMGLRGSVIFTGIRSDIPELLKSMDVFLFPSLYEGLPVTLIEAQASGLKCIASDTISTEVKITDLVEFISLRKTPEYWAKQVLKYANGYERKDRSTEIINAGYDIKESAKWLENFYISVVNPVSVDKLK